MNIQVTCIFHMTTKQSVCDDQGEPLYSYLVLTLPSRNHRNQSASSEKLPSTQTTSLGSGWKKRQPGYDPYGNIQDSQAKIQTAKKDSKGRIHMAEKDSQVRIKDN